MSDIAAILIGTALVNNLVLTGFLGLCPFFGASQRADAARGAGLATLFVLTLSAGGGYLLDRYLLTPHDMTHLRPLGFILVIAALVQCVEAVLRKTNPLLYNILGIFLPLITTNCAVLGVALLNTATADNFFEASLAGLGAGAGFALALAVFAGLRERLRQSCVPAPFRGAAIAMVTAGIMSVALTGLSGLAGAVVAEAPPTRE